MLQVLPGLDLIIVLAVEDLKLLMLILCLLLDLENLLIGEEF